MLSKLQKIVITVLVLVFLIAADVYISTIPEPEPNISVKEGYAETSVLYPPIHEPNGSRVMVYNKTVTTSTDINNGSGYLNFTVKVLSGYDDQGIVNIEIEIFADGSLPSNLKPTGFRFEAISMNKSNNDPSFSYSYNGGVNVTNATFSSPIYDGSGAGHRISGFYVNSSTFSARSWVIWFIWDYGKPYTLRLNAVILGLPKEVKATIDISMEGSETS